MENRSVEDGLGFAGLLPGHAERQMHRVNEYAAALSKAIGHHCQGKAVPEQIAKQCPHYAWMLNVDLEKHLAAQKHMTLLNAMEHMEAE